MAPQLARKINVLIASTAGSAFFRADERDRPPLIAVAAPSG
jgi:hypothetical protein